LVSAQDRCRSGGAEQADRAVEVASNPRARNSLSGSRLDRALGRAREEVTTAATAAASWRLHHRRRVHQRRHRSLRHLPGAHRVPGRAQHPARHIRRRRRPNPVTDSGNTLWTRFDAPEQRIEDLKASPARPAARTLNRTPQGVRRGRRCPSARAREQPDARRVRTTASARTAPDWRNHGPIRSRALPCASDPPTIDQPAPCESGAEPVLPSCGARAGGDSGGRVATYRGRAGSAVVSPHQADLRRPLRQRDPGDLEPDQTIK
jgi:hypothetical protein